MRLKTQPKTEIIIVKTSMWFFTFNKSSQLPLYRSIIGVSPHKIGKLGDLSKMLLIHSHVEAEVHITSCKYKRTLKAGPAINRPKRGKSIKHSSSEKSLGKKSLPVFKVKNMCSKEAK